MICMAHFPEDREDIIALWSSCFGDTRQYIEFFLDNIPSENVLFVYKNEGNIAGMFFLMPASLRYMTGRIITEKPVFYVYAVGVSLECRKQGIAGAMLKFAKEYAKERNAELCLIPATGRLASYYANRGFILLPREEKTLEAAEYPKQNNIINNGRAVTSGIEECLYGMYAARDDALKDECALLWSRENFRFALAEHLYTGGLIYLKACEETAYSNIEYVLGRWYGDEFVIREALAEGYKMSGGTDFDVMITDMVYGSSFIAAAKEMDGAYINLCFN